jgi:hypothetical protein
MKLPAKGGPVSRRRAIANLLRLADTDLRDARVLMWIPIQGGQVFQPDGGHPTDLMAATLPI